MNARMLLLFFDSIYLLALTAWVGSIAFFSFGVAPIIFKVLSKESAASFVRTLFPRYYLWGATAAAIALPALVCGPMSYPELRGPRIGVQAMFVLAGALVMLYCGNSLTPQINAARDGGPDTARRFDALHKRSVILNAIVLFIGIGLLVAFAARPAPRSSGIVERAPGELNPGLNKFLKDAAEIDRKLKDPAEFDRLWKEREAAKAKSGTGTPAKP